MTTAGTAARETPAPVERLRRFAGAGLAKSYGAKEALRGVDIEVRPGELVGVLGPNGAGKTTCFNVMVGLLRPKRGTVTLDGVDVTRLPMHERARRGLGYLPQEPSVFRKLTVRENLDLVFEARGISRNERRSRGDSLLSDFGIAAVERSRAETLSGGERRRLEIARAIAALPTFLLLDEPFTGVDPIAVTDVRALLIGLAQKRRLGVLITDHNAREVLEICDRVYVIHEGSLLAEGTPQVVAANEAVRRVYLGDRFTFESIKSAAVGDEAWREGSECKAPRSERPRRTLAYVEGASDEGNVAGGPLSSSARRKHGD